MKNKFILSFCLIIILTISSFSQTNYKAGYIVKDKDTIYGEIDYRNDRILSEICRFKKGDEIKEYTPSEIDKYRFEGDRLFISKEIDQKKVFLEVLINGKLNVFTFTELVGTSRFFVSNDKYPLEEITYAEKKVIIDDTDYLKNTNKHIGVLNLFTSDVPSIQRKIGVIEKPRRNNLIKLAKTYHYKVCDTEDCIVYKSKQRKVKVLAELRSGLKSYTSVRGLDLLKKNYLKTEALIYFSIPSLGDEWYFKTGVAFSKLKYYESKFLTQVMTKETLIQIPLQFQYIKNKGITRPKFSFGLGYSKQENIFSEDFIIDIHTGLGLNIKISKNIFVSLNSEFELSSIYEEDLGQYYYDGKKLYSINITTGLVYEF